jgi:hypothetical protein
VNHPSTRLYARIIGAVGLIPVLALAAACKADDGGGTPAPSASAVVIGPGPTVGPTAVSKALAPSGADTSTGPSAPPTEPQPTGTQTGGGGKPGSKPGGPPESVAPVPGVCTPRINNPRTAELRELCERILADGFDIRLLGDGPPVNASRRTFTTFAFVAIPGCAPKAPGQNDPQVVVFGLDQSKDRGKKNPRLTLVPLTAAGPDFSRGPNSRQAKSLCETASPIQQPMPK